MSTNKPIKPPMILRPTLETKFHIDYDWWERSGKNLNVFLRSILCDEHREAFLDQDSDSMVDHVDPETGVVSQVPGIQYLLITHCSRQDDFITPQTSLVNAIFRFLISNGNESVSVQELSEKLNRPAKMMLRMLSGSRVYHGIRPDYEE